MAARLLAKTWKVVLWKTAMAIFGTIMNMLACLDLLWAMSPNAQSSCPQVRANWKQV